MNPLLELHALGQSIWLDDIHRGMLNNGDFQRLLEHDGVCGVTSNPAILKKAIVDHDDYDDAVKAFASHGGDARGLYEQLVVEDLRHAADLLRPVYERTSALDGYVSMEVSPHLAHDTDATITAGRRLWQLLDRPNAMIKVPATLEGLPAIRQLIAEGINVNATLLFSVDRYRAVAQAFIDGLSDRQAAGGDVSHVASVASFFMSRIDVLIDARLDEVGNGQASALRGQAAVNSAKLAWQDYLQRFASQAWEALAANGARPQRLLWASTGTKDPAYSDVKYIEELIASGTVNTVPLATLAAYRDHGQPALTLENGLEQAAGVAEEFAVLGIDMDKVAAQLESEGVDKFIKPFDILLDTLAERIAGS